MDLDYPTELRVVEQLDTFREMVQSHSKSTANATQFIRKVAVPESPMPAENLSAASNNAPNGFWSRFRSLLAT
jgi:hypothetical protein